MAKKAMHKWYDVLSNWIFNILLGNGTISKWKYEMKTIEYKDKINVIVHNEWEINDIYQSVSKSNIRFYIFSGKFWLISMPTFYIVQFQNCIATYEFETSTFP